jgi:hypothetical protein
MSVDHIPKAFARWQQIASGLGKCKDVHVRRRPMASFDYTGCAGHRGGRDRSRSFSYKMGGVTAAESRSW